jgi:hypothetical protein
MNSSDFQQVLTKSQDQLKTDNLPKWLDKIKEKKQKVLILTTFLLFIDNKEKEKEKENELMEFKDYYAFIKKTDFRNLDIFEFIKNVENLNEIGSLQVYIRFSYNDLLFVFNKDNSSLNINFINLNEKENLKEKEKEKEKEKGKETKEDLDKFVKIKNIDKFEKKFNFACEKGKEILKYFIKYKKSIIFDLVAILTEERNDYKSVDTVIIHDEKDMKKDNDKEEDNDNDDCLSLILSDLKDIIPLCLISRILKKFKKSIKNVLINPSTNKIIFKILKFKKIKFSEKRKLPIEELELEIGSVDTGIGINTDNTNTNTDNTNTNTDNTNTNTDRNTNIRRKIEYGNEKKKKRIE